MKEDKSLLWQGIIQGIVALGLGLLMVFSRNTATLWIGIAVAVYLFVAGIIQTTRGLGLQSAGFGSTVLIRGIVGLIVGGILLVMAWFDWGSLAAGYTILALGLLVFGGLGLFVNFFQRGRRQFEWGPVLVNLALMVWGFLIFFSRGRDFD